MLGPSVERTRRRALGGAHTCVEKMSTFNLSGLYFCSIKQLLILKLMDDKEVVEQYAEVLLDQKTHAETPDHLAYHYRCDTGSRPMNEQWRPLSNRRARG